MQMETRYRFKNCHRRRHFSGAYERPLSSMAGAITPIPVMKSVLMRRVRRIHYLENLTLTPRIRAWRNDGRWYVRSSFLLLRAIQPESTIPICNHLWIRLPVCCKAHHELRNARGQVFIEVGMPGMPRLALGMDEFFHQCMLGNLRDPRRYELT